MTTRQRLTLASTAALAAMLLAGCVQEMSGPSTSPETPAPTSSTSPAPSTNASADESRCGVPGFEEQSSLVQGPDVEWSYIGSVAVPGSDEVGPGEITAGGVRTCFAHTAAGAVTMAYNAAAQGSNPDTSVAFSEYVWTGPGREEIVSDVSPASGEGRLGLAGFRVLAYDGASARIDVAARVDASSGAGLVSGIYELVWEEGDWRIYASSGEASGASVEPIESLSGYTAWSEGQ